MNNKQELIDKNIELFFFDPSRERDEFIEFYKSLNPDRVKKEGNRYRYSPLFLVLKDARYCFAVGKEFNECREKLHEANFAGIILINIGFTNMVKKIFSGQLEKFAEQYMDIHDSVELNGLRLLRNSLEHSFYGLFTYENRKNKDGEDEKVKVYFSLGFYNFIIKKDPDWKRDYPSEMFMINPRKLFTQFESGCKKFKNDLLDHSNTKLRSQFTKYYDVDQWIATGP